MYHMILLQSHRSREIAIKYHRHAYWDRACATFCSLPNGWKTPEPCQRRCSVGFQKTTTNTTVQKSTSIARSGLNRYRHFFQDIYDENCGFKIKTAYDCSLMLVFVSSDLNLHTIRNHIFKKNDFKVFSSPKRSGSPKICSLNMWASGRAKSAAGSCVSLSSIRLPIHRDCLQSLFTTTHFEQ